MGILEGRAPNGSGARPFRPSTVYREVAMLSTRGGAALLLVGAISTLGWAGERLDRGAVAMRTAQGKVYLSWRLLADDPADVAFHVERRQGGQVVRVSVEPVRKTADFVDASAPAAEGLEYAVRTVAPGRGAEAVWVPLGSNDPAKPYRAIKLEGNYTVQKAGIADLDGDGRLDFVFKQPNENVDPYEKYWEPSTNSFKLEAYRHDGTLLWRRDLGWAIERGIWYSPYVVYDLDGDGRAEVAVKTGEGDPRDKDGRVQSGPEYLTILDGQTGKPRLRVDWPARELMPSYNYASRNQLAVALLDGKTPSLIVLRGTYNAMVAVAYRLQGAKLEEQWRWSNQGLPRQFQGQGAHWTHAADVDEDGRDEVVLGSITLDDNGKVLWTTGLGHPDHAYVGDIDPSRPGLEIYYGIESRGKKNTMCLVEARTGKLLWGHDQPTQHIHSSGLCSDIDPAYPGSECYSGERDDKSKRWLHSARGELIGTADLGGLAPAPPTGMPTPSANWSAAAESPTTRAPNWREIQGDVIAVVDLDGDWREEILTTVAGEIRIYSTPIPARDRRTTLLADRLYRMDVVAAAMGYFQVPMTSYDLATAKR